MIDKTENEMVKRKKKKMSNAIKVAMIGAIAIIAAAVIGICNNYTSEKKSDTTNNITQDSGIVNIGNKQTEVKSDIILGNKVESTVNNNNNYSPKAPNALIVTTNQSGGTNNVNITDKSIIYPFFKTSFKKNNDGHFILVIPFSYHNRNNPIVQVFQINDNKLQEVIVPIESDSANNITINSSVAFDGQVVIK